MTLNTALRKMFPLLNDDYEDVQLSKLRMKLRLILLLILTTISLSGYGQDYHFSQFYASPLSLNPALTGSFAEHYRVSSIYRSQLSGINSRFETTALGAEMNFRTGHLKRDQIGVGLYVYRDNLGDNIFMAQSIAISGAYHRSLDVFKRHRISIGGQVGFVQKSIDPSRLTFSDQYEEYEIVPGLSSMDGAINNQVTYFNINLGGFYSFKITPRLDASTGISVFQVNNPKESYFTTSTGNKLDSRYTTYLGLNYRIKRNISLSPKILYMNQERSQNINLGGNIGYDLGKKLESTLFIGGWFRMADAAIGMAGVKWKTYILRFSYDATVSGLKEIKNASNIKANPKAGAFEISFVMTGKLPKAIPDTYTIPCTFY